MKHSFKSLSTDAVTGNLVLYLDTSLFDSAGSCLCLTLIISLDHAARVDQKNSHDTSMEYQVRWQWLKHMVYRVKTSDPDISIDMRELAKRPPKYCLQIQTIREKIGDLELALDTMPAWLKARPEVSAAALNDPNEMFGLWDCSYRAGDLADLLRHVQVLTGRMEMLRLCKHSSTRTLMCRA